MCAAVVAALANAACSALTYVRVNTYALLLSLHSRHTRAEYTALTCIREYIYIRCCCRCTRDIQVQSALLSHVYAYIYTHIYVYMRCCCCCSALHTRHTHECRRVLQVQSALLCARVCTALSQCTALSRTLLLSHTLCSSFSLDLSLTPTLTPTFSHGSFSLPIA